MALRTHPTTFLWSATNGFELRQAFCLSTYHKGYVSAQEHLAHYQTHYFRQTRKMIG